jgi:hypothetical protein
MLTKLFFEQFKDSFTQEVKHLNNPFQERYDSAKESLLRQIFTNENLNDIDAKHMDKLKSIVIDLQTLFNLIPWKAITNRNIECQITNITIFDIMVQTMICEDLIKWLKTLRSDIPYLVDSRDGVTLFQDDHAISDSDLSIMLRTILISYCSSSLLNKNVQGVIQLTKVLFASAIFRPLTCIGNRRPVIKAGPCLLNKISQLDSTPSSILILDSNEVDTPEAAIHDNGSQRSFRISIDNYSKQNYLQAREIMRYKVFSSGVNDTFYTLLYYTYLTDGTYLFTLSEIDRWQLAIANTPVGASFLAPFKSIVMEYFPLFKSRMDVVKFVEFIQSYYPLKEIAYFSFMQNFAPTDHNSSITSILSYQIYNETSFTSTRAALQYNYSIDYMNCVLFSNIILSLMLRTEEEIKLIFPEIRRILRIFKIEDSDLYASIVKLNSAIELIIHEFNTANGDYKLILASYAIYKMDTSDPVSINEVQLIAQVEPLVK